MYMMNTVLIKNLKIYKLILHDKYLKKYSVFSLFEWVS